ncbi:hypothetical protein K466DRAFT_483510 [Polyporus arcularius HHB13444]|uniref:DUF6533 domain-containing protein n=1 Tax=Polyporus arcularius HHB13444 TaxID=1314778 RepID=A0A5C3PTC3_9APHY|nr:hypothetical protein K466DRAFT_483510 [Polyporus arcularius HHB13444]
MLRWGVRRLRRYLRLTSNLRLRDPAALIVYDQLLTFDREVRLVWRRKVTGATVLFLLNRYFLLARFLVIFGAYGISSQEVSSSATDSPVRLYSCVQSVLAGEVLQTAPYLIWAAFASLRVYALTDHLWWLAAIVFFTSCMPLATNTVMLLLTRSSVIIGDMIVLGVSWQKTYSTWRVAKSAAIKASFAATILRDG